LAQSANVQKLYTSVQPLSQWWPHPGLQALAGTVGERYLGGCQWVYPVPDPFTRLIVEIGGYQVVAGTTVWRLYSDSALYRGTFTGGEQSVSVSVNWTAHAFSAPQYLTVVPYISPLDGRRFTRLVLTAENMDSTTRSRLYTMHVRPAPDEP